MSLIVSLLIIYQTNNDLELGSWTSFFSLFTIIAMYIFGKYYNQNKKQKVLLCCAIAILVSFTCVLFSINMVTVIIYDIVYYVFMNILLNITEANLFDYSNKEPFREKFNTEYFIFRELFLNLGRILRIYNFVTCCRNHSKSWFIKYIIYINYNINNDYYLDE